MSAKPVLSKLRTEQLNAASADLDRLSALEIARVINSEDAKVAAAVERVLPQVAVAIDAIAGALADGGRLIYVGAGTSGRIAALDAAECPPTFNTAPQTVQYVIAGGDKALSLALEANEDSRALGRRDIMRKRPTRKDVVVALAASGHTPYTVAALEYAHQRGAATVSVTCNPDSPLERIADIPIVIDVGPEVVAGSTRMKAATAQKLVVNMLSTGAMARLGYVYGNLMVNLHLSNRKLLERGFAILQQAAGIDREVAEKTLLAAKMSVPVALVMLKAGVSKGEAVRRLKRANGHVRKAIGM
ncbi:MAG: N-acetylmuramic acid 6-phosphate etherase [Terriglobales bacterium]